MKHDPKHISIMKNREKVLRLRNKRKCKRKKNTRAHKRYCHVKESIHHNKIFKDNINGVAPNMHTIPTLAPQAAISVLDSVRKDSRIKHAQNVWIKTYQNIVKWQSCHQINYWHLYVLRSKAQNKWFGNRLVNKAPASGYESNSFPCLFANENEDTYGDTDDEDSDNSKDFEGSSIEKIDKFLAKQKQAEEVKESYKIDEEFLAFMEVSARHRLEHRRMKN